MQPAIKLLSVIEATTVTGPAKNLLNFCRRARTEEFAEASGLPRVETSIVTFSRGPLNEDFDTATPNQFVAAARDAGIDVEVIPERFRFDTGVIGALRRAVEGRAPDVLQTHMIKSHFLVRLSGLARERAWVAYHHGYTSTDLKMLAYNRLNRWSLPSAARVVTVCGPFAERLAREGVRRDRISVLHNSVVEPVPVSETEVIKLRAKYDIGEGERIVLCVGRLSREKGHVDLVRALGHLRRINARLSFKLLIVGEGPERVRVERAADEEGIGGRVLFAGHAADVRPFYAAADALALPSHSEGSPNVLLEAMAAGLPSAATSVGGVTEIATDGETALIVPARDAEAMARALDRLLTDSALAAQLASAARLRVLTDFSPEAYARALVRIYQGLTPRSAGVTAPTHAA